MAIKLWIDDIRPAPDHLYMTAATVTSAINAIAMFGEQMELISLDHDISHQVSFGSRSSPFPCDETFTPVAWFIGHYYKNLPKMPKVVMHTSNIKGGENMRDIIKGLIPEAVVELKPMGAATRPKPVV